MMTESCSGRNAYPKQVTRIVIWQPFCLRYLDGQTLKHSMGRGLVEFGIPYLC